MSTIAASNSFAWPMAVKGQNEWQQMASSCMLLELSEWHDEKTNKQRDRGNR